MPKKVEYTVVKPIHGYKAGQNVTISVDANGVPLDRLWRRRLRDAKIDGCIVKTEQPRKLKTQKEDG